MTPQAIRSQFGHLYGSGALPVLEELFMSELAQHPSIRDRLFKTVSTDRDIWQASEVHDLPLFSAIGEGSEYNFARSKQGASKTLTISKYGLGVSVSEEMIDDGKFDLLADMIRKLAKSGRESQEIQAAAIFNTGFDSATSADGQYVWDTDHTLPSGVQFRNKLSSNSDLSTTSLDTMLSDFETQFVGDSGIIVKMQPKVLLVHPTSKRYAMELIGSDLKADTADNNMNSLRGEGLTAISSPHLTDPDAWFMLAAPADTGLRIVSRKPIETKAAGPDVGFSTDTIAYKSRYREAIGVTHAYGIFGTPGA